ncbi:MAG: AAA family ATPase [Deltaproteobacteria bacterium]|nr:AAA family ATPase [Deltaproteobacteria bacterium]
MELNDHFKPTIHIIGLPGAGKTTLSKKLARKLKFPIYRIGEYRSKFPMTIYGEADAWLALFRDLSRKKWKNCILETTGLNCRESFLNAALPFGGRVTIKLEAKRKVLYERIKKKKKSRQGGEWLFSTTFRDKFEFTRKSFKTFKIVPADIRIDTSTITAPEVYKIALKKLELLTPKLCNSITL